MKFKIQVFSKAMCLQNVCLRNTRTVYSTTLEKGEEGKLLTDDRKMSFGDFEGHPLPRGN